MGYRKNTISNVNAEGQERPNVPNLRFSQSKWYKAKLGDVCVGFDYGLGAEAMDYDGTNKYIRITDIDDETSKYKSEKLTSPSFIDNSCIVNENDILFARTGASTGKTYLYQKNDGLLYFAGFLIRANVSKDFNPYFVFLQTKTNKYLEWVGIMSCRSGQPGINAQEYKKLPIYLTDIQSQNKVANFFRFLDTRIETQSKIIEEIISFKNCIANRLIFNNTALKQIVKLEDISTLKNGYAFKSDSYNDDGRYKVITIANVSGDRYIQTETSNRVVKINNDIQEHQVLKINDILISLTGNVGRVSLVNEDDCLLNQRVGVLIPFNINFREYIYQVLSTKKFENAMILAGQGVAQKNIGDSDVLGFKIPFTTDYDYLNKLSSILQKIDHKIQKEKDILELYKKQKAYLLQNLFI